MILTFKDGNGQIKNVRLKTISSLPPVTIGRGKSATISIHDNSCSRIHSAIRYWDDIFIVRDMNSRNGTLVNGQKIRVAVLEPGDVLRIGATEFRAAAEEGSSHEVTMLA